MISSVHIWEVGLALSGAFLIGAIPFSYLVAMATRRVDLKEMKAGTISGTALYRIAGFLPLVVAGVLDIGKGILVAEIFRYDGQLLRILAIAAAVAGHNWSPFLKWAGGRGVAVTLGGLGFAAWPATLWLGGLFGLGRLVERTGIFIFFGYLCLPLLVLITSNPEVDFYATQYFTLEHHPWTALGTVFITSIVFLKRAMGNKEEKEATKSPTKSAWLERLLYDRSI